MTEKETSLNLENISDVKFCYLSTCVVVPLEVSGSKFLK